MNSVWKANWGSGSGNMHDLAFGRVKGHLPGLFPVNEVVQVVLESVGVEGAIDFSVQHGIVSEKFEGSVRGDTGGHVVYVEEEEERSEYCALWDTRAHMYLA